MRSRPIKTPGALAQSGAARNRTIPQNAPISRFDGFISSFGFISSCNLCFLSDYLKCRPEARGVNSLAKLQFLRPGAKTSFFAFNF